MAIVDRVLQVLATTYLKQVVCRVLEITIIFLIRNRSFLIHLRWRLALSSHSNAFGGYYSTSGTVWRRRRTEDAATEQKFYLLLELRGGERWIWCILGWLFPGITGYATLVIRYVSVAGVLGSRVHSVYTRVQAASCPSKYMHIHAHLRACINVLGQIHEMRA